MRPHTRFRARIPTTPRASTCIPFDTRCYRNTTPLQLPPQSPMSPPPPPPPSLKSLPRYREPRLSRHGRPARPRETAPQAARPLATRRLTKPPQLRPPTPRQVKHVSAPSTATACTERPTTKRMQATPVVPLPTWTPNHHDGEHATHHPPGPRRLQALVRPTQPSGHRRATYAAPSSATQRSPCRRRASSPPCTRTALRLVTVA